MKTQDLKALADKYSVACRIVAQAVSNGTVTKETGSVGKELVKLNTQVAARHGLSEDALRNLKEAMKIKNSGQAFELAFNVKLAHIGSYASQQLTIEALASHASGVPADRANVTVEDESDAPVSVEA